MLIVVAEHAVSPDASVRRQPRIEMALTYGKSSLILQGFIVKLSLDKHGEQDEYIHVYNRCQDRSHTRNCLCTFMCSWCLFLDRRSSGFHRSEEHTSELQSLRHLVCRLL